MKYISAAILTLMLSANLSAMDDNTREGAQSFALVSVLAFIAMDYTSDNDKPLSFFNYASFEIGSDMPIYIDEPAPQCTKGHSDRVISNGEVRLNIAEYKIFYFDAMPWMHKSCVAGKDRLVYDGLGFRFGGKITF